MPRRKQPPRLYLRTRKWGSVYVIRDGTAEVGTGCGPDSLRGAEEALARYIAGKWQPPAGTGRLSDILVADAVTAYLRERGPLVARPDFLRTTARPIIEWWEGKTLADIRGQTCRDYVAWRMRRVSGQTARHDLKTLRAAVMHWHREHGPLDAVPAVTLPAKAEPREDYWLTRDEVAARIRAARRHPQREHVARMLLLGCYTGTRPGAILALRWLPSTSGGWIDLDTRTLHRRAEGERGSKKAKPKARLHDRLVPHLVRWRAADMARGITHVVHYGGMPVVKLRRSWSAVAREAGATRADGPHIMRHTAATWLLQSGVPMAEAAGYLGMTTDTLERVYGHHSPAHQQRAASMRGR